MSLPGNDASVRAWLRDDKPFDLLSAAVGALRDLYRDEAEIPLQPLIDDEPAPRFAMIEHP